MMHVLELRQYTLHPGRRDVLIDLFERAFVEPQEAEGMRLVGQFRDADDPDRFVWLRAFDDMVSRAEGLAAFYGGPVWRAHRDEANATMIDSSDVLLLRPLAPQTGFAPPSSARPPHGSGSLPGSLVVATICYRDVPVDDELGAFFERAVRPALTAAGAPPLAVYQTESAENTFPALPVRTGEHVVVWFSAFADAEHHRDHMGRLTASAAWRDTVLPGLAGAKISRVQQLRLEPTPRSQLR